MSDDSRDDGPPDEIADAVISGSASDRVRALRPSALGGYRARVAGQVVLLLALAATLPLYLAFPESTAQYLPSANPLRATPRVVLIGAFGFAMVATAGAMLVAVDAARLYRPPEDEDGAFEMLLFEEFATIVGCGLGGAAVALTLAYFCLGLAGGGAVQAYQAAMSGINPYASSGLGVTVGHLAGAALSVAVAVAGAGGYISVQLPAPNGSAAV